MKSTNANKKSFTMEDFEKGLMLAGYISPNTISEVNEREQMANYEADLSKKNKALYFKRVVLAAEIAYQLHNEPSFGHVKFQKLVYLCEHAASMGLNSRYSKQAAGPFDNKFMHNIDNEFKKKKWFNVELIRSNQITRFKYTPLDNCDNYKNYFASYFKETQSNIQHVIDLFKSQKTDNVEIAATIYACILELFEKNLAITKENLLELFYDWSKQKSRFTESKIISTWDWMIEQNIVPKNTPN